MAPDADAPLLPNDAGALLPPKDNGVDALLEPKEKPLLAAASSPPFAADADPNEKPLPLDEEEDDEEEEEEESEGVDDADPKPNVTPPVPDPKDDVPPNVAVLLLPVVAADPAPKVAVDDVAEPKDGADEEDSVASEPGLGASQAAHFSCDGPLEV
jgi:hypothetical protein